MPFFIHTGEKIVCVWITFFLCFFVIAQISLVRQQLTWIWTENWKPKALHLKLRVFYVYKFKHLMLSNKLLSVCMECLQEGIYWTMLLFTFCYWILCFNYCFAQPHSIQQVECRELSPENKFYVDFYETHQVKD